MVDCRVGSAAGRPDAVLPVLAMGVSLLLSGCKPAQQPDAALETIRIGAFKGEVAALVWLADSQGLFAKHGLQAQVTGFDSGLAAVDALLAGSQDIATGADAVFVNKSLEPGSNGNLRILGEIASSESIEIVARRDRGLAAPADLRNKRVALTRRTASPYFLDRFLLYHHLDPQAIEIVDLAPQLIVEALVEGSVDAAVTWEPLVGELKLKLGDNALSWPAQSGQQFNFLLISTLDFADTRQRAARKMFRALADAEDLLRTDPARARQALARQLALDEPYLLAALPKHNIGLSLDQALLVAMESQARWRTAGGQATLRQPPNYLKSLMPELLGSVKPDAVTIYR